MPRWVIRKEVSYEMEVEADTAEEAEALARTRTNWEQVDQQVFVDEEPLPEEGD